jgi:hypothetical protein
MINWQKYIIVFIITTLIFFTAFSVSNYLNDRKVSELRGIQDKISIDILSLETQFELLEDSSCKKIDSSILSQELNTLANKLSYAEEQAGIDSEEVESLKKQYTLLEIKDYMLTKRVSEKCSFNPTVILYFYSNKTGCDDCTKQGHVLTYLREQFPQLRVYSFDYDLPLSTLKTLISIHEIQEKLPALVIKDKVYYGFMSVEDIQKVIPSLLSTSTATTTIKVR